MEETTVIHGIPFGSVELIFGMKLEDTTASTIRSKVGEAIPDFLANHPKGALLLVHPKNRAYLVAIFKGQYEIAVNLTQVKLNKIFLVEKEDEKKSEGEET